MLPAPASDRAGAGSQCPVTVVIPTYERVAPLTATLAHVRACNPAPAQIIVHVDNGDRSTAAALNDLAGPDLKVLYAQSRQGPGGGRNRAIAAARHEIIVSLDDDSYPVDADFFARVLALFGEYPQAAVIGTAIFHRGEAIAADERRVQLAPDFVGCGCAYRRTAFLATHGYQPIALAYGVEEVDMALQLHDQESTILASPWLRIRHETDRQHQINAAVTAAHIRNTALLAWVRYPLELTPLGMAQVGSRVWWSVRNGRFNGVLTGLITIASTIWRFRRQRAPVRKETVAKYRKLRQMAAIHQTAQ